MLLSPSYETERDEKREIEKKRKKTHKKKKQDPYLSRKFPQLKERIKNKKKVSQ